MSFNVIFYDSAAHEVGRATYEVGDLVAIPDGAVDFRQFPIDVTLPPQQ